MPALRTRDTGKYPGQVSTSYTDSRTALEVTTDAPQPPTLTIISPTPRAFTFPSAHNLNDSSPYSSPSNSPFEPDLRPLALSSCTTPPPPFSMIRTLSPASSFTSSSPSPSTSHKRRKSSSSSCDVERRPKKGDEDYVKRPENAFILFRRKCCEERQAASSSSSDPSDPSSTASSEPPVKKQRQADLSKTISQQWKGLPAEERAYWEQLAKEKKKEHEKLHPNYVYRPQRAKDKEGRSIKNSKRSTSVNKGRRGSDYGQDTDSEYLSSATTGSSVSFVVPMAPRHHGRSASAPTPPLPYQTVQVPSVYHMTPSCPTSPSLLPMISRRSAGSGNPEDVMQNFDFLPSEPLMMSQFGNGFEGVQVRFIQCLHLRIFTDSLTVLRFPTRHVQHPPVVHTPSSLPPSPQRTSSPPAPNDLALLYRLRIRILRPFVAHVRPLYTDHASPRTLLLPAGLHSAQR